MMMSPPVSRRWIFSRGAGTLYFICALMGLGLLIFFVAFAVAEALVGPLPRILIVDVVLFLGLLAGMTALSILYLAMGLCILNFEKETLAGSFYAPLFWLLGPLAALIYYFARYRKLLDTELNPVRTAVSA